MRQFAEKLGVVKRKPVTPWLPEGVRVYCVGDVHGRDDLLETLCEQVADDASGYDGDKVAVFLGDYVDRGPGSKGVVDQLLDDPLPDFQKVYLRGNHEQAMLDFMEHPPVGEAWIRFGGHATITSYGVPFDRLPSRPDDFVELSESLREAVPREHCNFMHETQLCYTVGSYFFCHAGVRPGVAIEKQSPDDLLWIREEFTGSNRNHEKIIVHGHTVTDEAEILPNRIGIDTGAYDSGVLTCLVLEDDTRRLIQT